MTPYKMAWQMACQSSSTSAGLHLLSPTSVVSMKVRNIPSSAETVSSSAPSPNHSFQRVGRDLRLHHFPRLHVRFTITNPHRLMVVHHDEPSEPVHNFLPTFLQALHHHLDWAVAIFLLVCQKLERIERSAHHFPSRHLLRFQLVERTTPFAEHLRHVHGGEPQLLFMWSSPFHLDHFFQTSRCMLNVLGSSLLHSFTRDKRLVERLLHCTLQHSVLD